MPIEENRANKKEPEVEAVLDSIAGMIRDEGMTLEDYRNQRLEKDLNILDNTGNRRLCV